MIIINLPQQLSESERREAVRDLLTRRYRGAIDVTGEMIDAVLNGLAERCPECWHEGCDGNCRAPEERACQQRAAQVAAIAASMQEGA